MMGMSLQYRVSGPLPEARVLLKSESIKLSLNKRALKARVCIFMRGDYYVVTPNTARDVGARA